MSDKIDILKYKKALIFFITASVLILFFMPKGNKFKYEFTQGQPWMHEDLLTPFDFPIYKTEAESQEERRKITEQSLSYFILDSLSNSKQFSLLKERTNSYNGGRLFALIEKPVSQILKKGIIDENKYNELKGKTIAIVSGNLYEETPVSELYTQNSAFSSITNTLNKASHADSLISYAENINLIQYLTPNLIYDESLSNKIKHKNLSEILPTEGMVIEGSKIVYKGEQVTPEIFKILSSLKKEYEKNITGGNTFLIMLGRFFFVLMCMGCIFVLLMMFRSSMLTDNRCLIFLTALIAGFVILALQVLKVQPSFIYVIPFTIVPIYISSFFYSRPAIYIHFFMTLLIGNYAPASFEFVFLSSIAGVTAVIGFKKIYERGQMFLTGLLIFVVYMVGYTSLKLLHEGNLSSFTWFVPVLFLINSLLVIILYQFTFLFERLFGFVSISRLVELSDTNRKLLRDMTEIAPGTAQHVTQVANIAEAIIREVGGDPLLVRAGAMYHDIGKMKNPAFFIENQLSNISPHDKLQPEESARIIIEHVTYGVELAQKNHLPKAIIDFIRTHHGKSKTLFFYTKYINEHPEDTEAVEKFTYPGPNPFTKEQVVVMMADSCEAASRSLPHPDEESLNNLVDKIIDRQFTEGLYNDSNITLKEINIAKSVIKYKLKNIYHARIEYPEEKKI